MRILLIQPRTNENKIKFSESFVPLSLINIASVTPAKHYLKMIDENKEKIDFNENWDIVGITCHTLQANRAYELARLFKKKGSTVIMGGIHPTVMSKESLIYCDAVIIGEAEGIWKKIIKDISLGKLKKIYKNNNTIFIKPKIKYKLLNKLNLIQTTKGCPFNCNFCSISLVHGKKIKNKDIKIVIEEIKEYLKYKGGIYSRFVYFTDDNIIANRQYSIKLFKELSKLNIYWISQVSINIAYDDLLLDLAYKSGCRLVYIGFESINQNNLDLLNKKYERRRYEECINKIKEKGIIVIGSFIFGLEKNLKDFDMTKEFIFKNKIDLVELGPIIPYPGTKLFKDLKADNKILTTNWDKYYGIVIKTDINKKLIEEKIKNIYTTFYSYPNIIKRVLNRAFSIKKMLFVLLLNLNAKRSLNV